MLKRDEFFDFIAELETQENIALLLCTFLGLTKKELSTLTVNSLLEDGLFLYNGENSRVFKYSESPDRLLLKALLKRMSEEEIHLISKDMDTRFSQLGELINKNEMTFSYIRECGKAAGAF
ncbi:hypothetical protein ABE82_26335 (plasmid) [Paenibacillus peoriae]|uniref:hypothetical protein n=1 Tax=Paenibacillus peoriae TaxID=59893 RepID=UPI00072289D3|nr:hypothetical protein [Paenibacillus peoriae]ALS09936.1 hypothetical protein ABE82_26335 [Paenibacillus peoriae]